MEYPFWTHLVLFFFWFGVVIAFVVVLLALACAIDECSVERESTETQITRASNSAIDAIDRASERYLNELEIWEEK